MGVSAVSMTMYTLSSLSPCLIVHAWFMFAVRSKVYVFHVPGMIWSVLYSTTSPAW